MALIDRLHDANRRIAGREYYRLWVNDIAVGFIDTQLLDELPPRLFTIQTATKRIDCRFAPEQSVRTDFESAIEDFFRGYFAKHNLSGWRDEYYAVSASFTAEPLFLTERATLSFLGVTGYGVHVNGYVEQSDGLYMWIGKRALDKPTSPGKLDQIAAGGIPHGMTPYENVIKECEEEAAIPRHLAVTAKPVSTISYAYDLPIGIRPDVMFNYDLRLPTDFTPKINDGEVDSFQLLPIAEVLDRVAETRDFKCNCAVVIIDFAIRHGLISPLTIQTEKSTSYSHPTALPQYHLNGIT